MPSRQLHPPLLWHAERWCEVLLIAQVSNQWDAAQLLMMTLGSGTSPPMPRRRAEDATRLQAGLPVPVRCCWNGAVAMDAAPFLDGVCIR